jgi:hypothetical protein
MQEYNKAQIKAFPTFIDEIGKLSAVSTHGADWVG